jgi:hypothetical protein
MTPATIEDIKKHLQKLPPGKVLELTLKLARFKKENKELLTYLLFEAGDEQGYVQSLQFEIDEMISDTKKGPSATVKKSLRRITRLITRQSKYIGNKSSAAELHLHFCRSLLSHSDNLLSVTSANTIYHQQLNKIEKLLPSLDEDMKHDLSRQLTLMTNKNVSPPKASRWWKRK